MQTGTPAALVSRMVRSGDFRAAWFEAWRPWFRSVSANGIPLGGDFLHRKEWEFIAIAEAFRECGMLQSGRRGIGFAVGREPLPALFAGAGCEIVATDRADDARNAWPGDWPADRQALAHPEICPAPVFEKQVVFERVDMRHIPARLGGFDFAWSCCAAEHLGSLQAGLDFLWAAIDCLRPGGVVAHTIEYNVSSNQRTIFSGPTVLFRRKDIEAFRAAVDAAGHEMAAPDFAEGNALEDRFLAQPPFEDRRHNLAHLRLQIGRYVATSMLVVVRRGERLRDNHSSHHQPTALPMK